MSELSQWVFAMIFSIIVIGVALFFLNSTSHKNSGDVATLTVKISAVALSIMAALTSFIAVTIID